MNTASAIDLSSALGISRRHVRRLAKSKAFIVASSEPGQPVKYFTDDLPFEIRKGVENHRKSLSVAAAASSAAQDAEPVLQGSHEVAATGIPTTLSEEERDRRDARLRVLKAADTFGNRAKFIKAYNAGEMFNDPETRDFVPRVCGTETLRRWRKYRDVGNAEALARPPGGKKKGSGTIDRDDELRDFMRGLLLNNQFLNYRQLFDLACKKFAPRPAKLTRNMVRYFANRFKKSHRAEIAARNDPDGWNNRFRSSTANQSEKVTRPNQLWQIDCSRTVVMCRDGRRYWVVGIIDVYTRLCVFLLILNPSTEAAGLLLRKAILLLGKPECVRGDGGAEFVGAHFQRVLRDLRIAWIKSTAYSPWLKAFIERLWGTFKRDLGPMVPGFLGYNVSDRRALRGRSSMRERRGKPEAELFEVSLTREQLQVYIDRWAFDVYPNRIHSGLKCTPSERAAQSKSTITVVSESDLDFILMKAPGGDGTRAVTKKGVQLEGAYYDAPELHAGFDGQRVEVLFDPTNVAKILCLDREDHKPICRAVCIDRLGGGAREELAIQIRQAQNHYRAETRKEASRLGTAIGKPGALADLYLGNGNSATSARRASSQKLAIVFDSPAMAAAREAFAARESKPSNAVEQLAAAEEFLAEQSSQPEEQWPDDAELLARANRITQGEQLTPRDLHFLSLTELTPEEWLESFNSESQVQQYPPRRAV